MAATIKGNYNLKKLKNYIKKIVLIQNYYSQYSPVCNI